MDCVSIDLQMICLGSMYIRYICAIKLQLILSSLIRRCCLNAPAGGGPSKGSCLRQFDSEYVEMPFTDVGFAWLL